MLWLLLPQDAVDALNAVNVLRDDPLLYLVVSLPLLGILGLAFLYKLKMSDNKDLREENSRLTNSIIESNKLSAEAITTQVEVMREMKTDQREAINTYQHKTDQILQHLLEIKSRAQNNVKS